MKLFFKLLKLTSKKKNPNFFSNLLNSKVNSVKRYANVSLKGSINHNEIDGMI